MVGKLEILPLMQEMVYKKRKEKINYTHPKKQ
jgi:hypothetical protein